MTKKTEDRMEDKCNSGVTRYLDKDGNEPTKEELDRQRHEIQSIEEGLSVEPPAKKSKEV